MSEHTPGPWQCGPSPSHDTFIADMSGTWVANTWWTRPDRVDEPTEVQRANARLIAAAPDLLDALRDTLSWCEHDWTRGFTTTTWPNAIVNARTAIAKATQSDAASPGRSA